MQRFMTTVMKMMKMVWIISLYYLQSFTEMKPGVLKYLPLL